ncbi:MAG: type II toxin-antitoxin system RelE/ParE family toxin [Cytophagales bacterium]|nr:type II toxin-antitoxin system RelE/ParE family toxin [Cytophagales bacterium]
MKVILSPLAEFKLQHLLAHLESEWGDLAKQKFLLKLKTSLETLASFPQAHPKINEVYKCVITKQTSLYYRVKSDTVEIITAFDNRQDPNKLEKEIQQHFD